LQTFANENRSKRRKKRKMKKRKRKEKNLKPPNETSFTLVDPMHWLASTPLFDVNFPIYFIAKRTQEVGRKGQI
jgi:hypothetical protein